MEWEVEYISSHGVGSMSNYVVVTLVPVRPTVDVMSIKVQCLRGMFQHGKIYEIDVTPDGFKNKFELPHGKEFDTSKKDWDGERIPIGTHVPYANPLSIMPRAIQLEPMRRGRPISTNIRESTQMIHGYLSNQRIGLRPGPIAEALGLTYNTVHNALSGHINKLFKRQGHLWMAIPITNGNNSQNISEARQA